MSGKMKTGVIGEQLAAEFLQQHGYEVIARNYRYKHAEIDMIVKKDNMLVFVEVKTRNSISFGEPETFVNQKKATKIIQGAEQFIVDYNWHSNIRFDIISVKLETPPIIDHFKDAFY